MHLEQKQLPKILCTSAPLAFAETMLHPAAYWVCVEDSLNALSFYRFLYGLSCYDRQKLFKLEKRWLNCFLLIILFVHGGQNYLETVPLEVFCKNAALQT